MRDITEGSTIPWCSILRKRKPQTCVQDLQITARGITYLRYSILIVWLYSPASNRAKYTPVLTGLPD